MADEMEYPGRLAEAERGLLQARLEARKAQKDDQAFVEGLARRHSDGNYLGLALSGGGIRSATFSLGFVQALARAKVLRHVDYLSTVSGGSYFGGFLGAYYQRVVPRTGTPDQKSAFPLPSTPKKEPEPPRTAAEVEAGLQSPRSAAVNWLRENGRYLAPGGAADGWMALAVVLRNLIAVNAVTWTMALTVFIALDLLREIVAKVGWGLFGHLPRLLEDGRAFLSRGIVWWSPSLILPAAVLAVAVLPLGLAYWFVPDDGAPPTLPWWQRVRSWWTTVLSAVVIPIGAATVVAWRIWKTRAPNHPIEWTPSGVAVAVGVGVTLFGWGWLIYARPKTKNDRERRSQLLRARLSRALRTSLIVFSALLLLTVVDSLGQTLYRHHFLDRSSRFQIGQVVALISGLAGAARGVQAAIGLLGTGKKVGVPLQLVALLGALVLITPILAGLSALGHGIVWQGRPPIAVEQLPPRALETCVSRALPTCEVAPHGRVRPKPPESSTPGWVWSAPPATPWCWPVFSLLIGLGLSFVFGRTYAFLNDSSISGLYAARLTRAYVGASNPIRADGADKPATEFLRSDVIQFLDYQPHANGGPLHIINTTLNETIGGRSRVEEKDRKGMNLAVGPAAVSVGVKHHALWERGRLLGPPDSLDGPKLTSTDLPGERATEGEFRVFPAVAKQPHGSGNTTYSPEALPLGHWMAISGAAASTALGSMTSLGLSLLCGVLNVRLGHWWKSGVEPRDRRFASRRTGLQELGSLVSFCFPVQSHLYDELVARFRGTDARSWYLTDGGHFENTGAYELIRRRAKTIVLVDNGADPQRHMSDLANLVRKARVDFDTRIEFIDPGAQQGNGAAYPMLVNLKNVLGTLSELGFGPPDLAGTSVKKYAALARVTYGSDPAKETEGWLLLVKPGLKDDDSEPVDVRQYKRQHGDFPQQTTADQFFDEAQWEAYRKLGEHIGTSLFPDTGSNENVLARFLQIVG